MNRVVSLALSTLATGWLPPLRAETGPGVHWRTRGFEAARMSLNSLASGPGGALIAVGDNGAVRSSDNAGLTWNTSHTGAYQDLRDVMWTATGWLAVGGRHGQAPVIQRSLGDDLWSTTWLAGLSRFECITHNPARPEILATGNNGSTAISFDADAWSPSIEGTETTSGIVWSGDQLLSVTVDGSVRTSPDGHAWTTRWSDPEIEFEALATNGTRHLACGLSLPAHEPVWLNSSDGITWTAETTGTPDPTFLALLPRMTDPTRDGRMRLRCLGPLRYDLDYIVEQSDTLEAAAWSELLRYSRGRMTPTETPGLGVRVESGFLTIDLPENPATYPRRFYRLRLEQVPP